MKKLHRYILSYLVGMDTYKYRIINDRGDVKPTTTKNGNDKILPNTNQKQIKANVEKKKPLEMGRSNEKREQKIILNKDRGDLLGKEIKKAVRIGNKLLAVNNVPTSNKDLSEQLIKPDTKLNYTKMKHRQKPLIEKVDGQIRTYLDLEGRKKLRQRYTVKLKKSGNNNCAENLNNNENKINDVAIPKIEAEKVKSVSSVINCVTQITTTKKKETNIHKKPVIRTIRRNDNRVYKAVTFTDQLKSITPLQIKIPNELKSNGSNTPKNFNIVSKPETVKPVRRERKRRLKQRITSPVKPIRYKSPPTEVAKWAPTSVDHHTKPYYDAWVDKTLTAKCSEYYDSDMNVLRSIEHPMSPVLVYERMKDERYTGRIVVRQRT